MVETVPSRVFDSLLAGVEAKPYMVTATRRRARFPEEHDYTVTIRGPNCMDYFNIRVFDGRPPFYKPWIEVYNITPLGESGCFAGPVEDLILALSSRALGPGGKLYIEYGWDPETLDELQRGVPPHFSRLGLRMALHGFTWLRDWYYPEGFWEGGQKLGGEKPVDARSARRHIEEAILEGRNYISRKGVYQLIVAARIRVLEQLLELGG